MNAEELKDTIFGIKILLNYLANMPAGLWVLSILLTILLVWALLFEANLGEGMILGAVVTVPCIIVLAIRFLFSFLATEKKFYLVLGSNVYLHRRGSFCLFLKNHCDSFFSCYSDWFFNLECTQNFQRLLVSK